MAHLFISSTKACYPGKLSLDLSDLPDESDESASKSLPSCLDCSLINTER